METSGTAKRLIRAIKPSSIEDLSAISAINRPGPLQAGLDKTYIANKLNNSPPRDLPENVAEILKASYWTLIYQEQIMKLFTDLAGFTSQEADDVRRAMGKKKMSVLEKYKEKFILGAQEIGGLLDNYAQQLWEDILGFADYCLAATTKVMVPNNHVSSTQIQDLVKDQYSGFVLSHDGDKLTPLVAQKVTQWYSKGKQLVYRYHLDDDSYVDCTSNHNFLLKKNLKMKAIEYIYQNNLELYSLKEQ